MSFNAFFDLTWWYVARAFGVEEEVSNLWGQRTKDGESNSKPKQYSIPSKQLFHEENEIEMDDKDLDNDARVWPQRFWRLD